MKLEIFEHSPGKPAEPTLLERWAVTDGIAVCESHLDNKLLYTSCGGLTAQDGEKFLYAMYNAANRGTYTSAKLVN